MASFRQFIEETEEELTELFGRDRLRKMIYERLDPSKKKEYIETTRKLGAIYELARKALGSVRVSQYNLSTGEGWRDYGLAMTKALRASLPRISDRVIRNVVISNDEKRVSVRGWGSWSLKTIWDQCEYISASIAEDEGMRNPDNYKAWL